MPWCVRLYRGNTHWGMIKKLYYKLIGMTPGDMPMVSYWKTKDHVEAKLTTKEGATLMVMEGEKHPMWGFPRGHLLIPLDRTIHTPITLEDRVKKYGPFSVLKHEGKQIFNEIWRKLDEGVDRKTIVKETLEAIDRLPIEYLKYDLMPAKTMAPAIKEIHRAWTKVAPSPRSLKLRDIVTLILQEDDGYRYRVQWMAIWWPLIKLNPVKILDKGLQMVEHGEVIGDMKERIRLLRKGLMLLLEDPHLKELFIKFFREVDWKKVRIKESDRYHFRGKYFKVDLDTLEY